jgi:hypothetical protein
MHSGLLLPLLTALLIATCPAQTTPNSPNTKGHGRTLAATFGKPSGVETGPEAVPQNQGFLQCATTILNPDFRHDNTADASQKLSLRPDPNSEAVIVGHGAPGVQCTGNGDSCTGDSSTMIAAFNLSDWQNLIGKLQGDFQSLTLLGCDVGQGTDGADLLYDIAKATQRPVRAPNSIIYCTPTGFTFASGGTWVQATPTAKPSPSYAPRYRVQPTKTYKFKVQGTLTPLPTGSIKVLDFKHKTYRQREFQTLNNSDPSTLLNLIDFSKPFETNGRPGAIVTGRLRLQLIVGGKPMEREFVLYNDELLEDLTDQNIFYHVDSGFSQYIVQLTK